MAQSSPEGIILGKGSVLKSLDLSINKEKVLSITQEQDKNKYSEEEFELIEYIQWIIRKIDKGDTPEETVRLLLFEREKIEQFKKK
jgi:hypothetical protein